MECYEVFISENAQNDLRDIARYISAQLSALTTAIRMVESIEKAIDRLSEMPKSYPPVIDDRLFGMGYRKLIVKNYIVFFIINEKDRAVDVDRILYGRRDWRSIL